MEITRGMRIIRLLIQEQKLDICILEDILYRWGWRVWQQGLNIHWISTRRRERMEVVEVHHLRNRSPMLRMRVKRSRKMMNVIVIEGMAGTGRGRSDR